MARDPVSRAPDGRAPADDALALVREVFPGRMLRFTAHDDGSEDSSEDSSEDGSDEGMGEDAVTNRVAVLDAFPEDDLERDDDD